jgi:hypothetical protein
VLYQSLHRAAGPGHIRRQSEHLDIGLIANDDARRCIIENKALRDIVHGNTELAALSREALIGRPMALEQQPDDDREHQDDGQQNLLANDPCRRRDVRRDRQGNQPSAKGNAPDRPGLLGRVRRTARHVMAAIESHLVSPQCDTVTHDRWKAGYNLRLAIGYRHARADPKPRSRTGGYRRASVGYGPLL